MADQSAAIGETRRSSRIASQPKKDDAKPAAKVTKKTTTKKRGAEAAAKSEEEEPVPKKTKAAVAAEKEAESSGPAPAITAIDIGDHLPSLVLKNEKDEDVDVATLTAEKGLILFLVPKADTPGCTNQACGFRDIYPDFTSSGYEVYCLSADTPAAQTKWQAKKNLPYPLLSDRNRVLIAALGAGEGGKTKRSHFIFEKGGKLVEKQIPVKPVESPKLALEFIQGHGSGS